MIYILYGPDAYSRQQELDVIKSGMGDAELLSLNTTVLDGTDISPQQIKDFCCTAPFLNPFRLIIVEGLLQRFEHDKKRGKEKNSGNDYNSATFDKWKNLSELLTDIPQSTTVVFIDEEVTAKNQLLKSLGSIAKAKAFPLMKESGLREWIGNKVRIAGGKISQGAVKLLIDYTGNDLWTLNNEVDKLLSFCADRGISEQDVRQVTSFSKEINIFNLVDRVLEKKTSEAQRLVSKMVKEGASVSYIITMILRQLRLIIKAKYMEPGKRSMETGFTSDFVMEKTLKQAKIYSIDQLKEVYHKILEMDVNIKTGKYDSDLAIDLLVLELCR